MAIGGSEWIIIILISIFLIFGSKKLPEISRQIGKAVGEYNRTRETLSKEIRDISNLDSQKIKLDNSKNFTIGKIIEGPVSSEREKLERIAKSLNIEFADKTDEELRFVINERMKKDN